VKVGFDLDGTLDRPALRDLALSLAAAGHEVHIISGCFLEAGDWQDHFSKWKKLVRLGLASGGSGIGYAPIPGVHVTILDAVDHEKFDRDYRLADLGLRKGAYIERNRIEVMFDDSELYCKVMPSMCGAQVVQVLR
jgi:hypothetical protein